MHKYTCTECPNRPFYTTFTPVYDDSHCPNCGQSETVTYHGEEKKEENHAEKFEAINNLMRKLYDARKAPLKYALSDLSEWLESDLDKTCTLLDELQNDVGGER